MPEVVILRHFNTRPWKNCDARAPAAQVLHCTREKAVGGWCGFPKCCDGKFLHASNLEGKHPDHIIFLPDMQANQEHMIVCESSLKPLVFFYLVHVHSVTNALVFTKSAESTIRLVQLFEYFEESRAAGAPSGGRKLAVRAYSSDLPPGDRKATLEQFKAQEIQMYVSGFAILECLFTHPRLVCSDLIARGMDIHHVSHVVSYDAPVDIRKYVHRVGRTARAGRDGDAWTLVEEQEVKLIAPVGPCLTTFNRRAISSTC